MSHFSDFSLKTENPFFFALIEKKGLHDKVTSLISFSLYTTLEHQIAFIV